jgi:two-component system, OmpR family, heavy metal sensor histidine kinase CusS
MTLRVHARPAGSSDCPDPGNRLGDSGHGAPCSASLSAAFGESAARTKAASLHRVPIAWILMEPEAKSPVEGGHPTRASSVSLVSRTDRLRAARARAAAADTAQLEFVQLALHDLQTPVAVLDLSMKLLAEDLAGAGPEAIATLRGAERAVRRIQQYIDHLVTSERTGPLRARRERVDVVSLLKDLVADYSHHAAVSGVALGLDVSGAQSLVLTGDQTLLCRVFQNLVENSLRHAGKGGRVLVEASIDGCVEVRVCNDGPSIPRNDRECIFDKFTGNVGEHGTTGIGLFFCRLAIGAHGGTVTVQDTPSWPTCFVVRLPLSAL